MIRCRRLCAGAVGPVASGAKLAKSFLPLRWVALFTSRIGRRLRGGKDVRAAPDLKDSLDQAIDLLTGKRTSRGSFKRGHQFARHPFCYRLTQVGFAG